MGDLIDLADYGLARAWRRAAIGQDTETASACLAASRKLMRKGAEVSQEAAPAFDHRQPHGGEERQGRKGLG